MATSIWCLKCSIVRASAGRAIVKQALPYVRCVGESRPLTLDRARLEAQTRSPTISTARSTR